MFRRQTSSRHWLSAYSPLILANLALTTIPLPDFASASQHSSAKKNAKKAAAKIAPKTKARVARGVWKAPNYADSDLGDVIHGDDADVRQAALDGLGKLNGAVVVTDADTGRILTVVGQKTAFKSGFQPCSTIKVPVALAALSESLVDRLTQIRLYGNTKVAMTEALARSNNQYFASLGEKLGFEPISYYARHYGL